MSSENDRFPNKEAKAAEYTSADMTGSNFNGVDLSNSQFWAVLADVVFKDCNMFACKFDDVNLGQANFFNINLSKSKFSEVNMSNVEFSSINMSGTRFSGLDMTNVEITDANMQGMKIDGILVSDLLESYSR